MHGKNHVFDLVVGIVDAVASPEVVKALKLYLDQKYPNSPLPSYYAVNFRGTSTFEISKDEMDVIQTHFPHSKLHAVKYIKHILRSRCKNSNWTNLRTAKDIADTIWNQPVRYGLVDISKTP